MVRRTRNARTRELARAKLDELREDAETLLPSSRNLRFHEYASAWLADVVQPNRAGTTHESYAGCLENHILPAIGSVRLLDLHGLHVEALLAKIAGGRTRELAYVVLQALFARAVRLRLIRSNPCEGVEKPKHDREPIRPFTREQAAAIITATREHPLHAAFVLAITTGMRQGDAGP